MKAVVMTAVGGPGHGGIGAHQGNYAEYTTIGERFAAPKPASLSFAEAAAGPLVLITAWESLHDRGRMVEGHRVELTASYPLEQAAAAHRRIEAGGMSGKVALVMD